MLAKETSDVFNDKGWIFEMKWDGYRAIAEKKGEEVILYSRNGLSFNGAFPIVADQLKNIPGDAVLDGEIIVLDEKGLPNFQYLQNYAENQNRPIQYQVFDLLELYGKDVTGLPLLERKELLKKYLPENGVIRFSDQILEKGKEFFELTKERNLEGIMAKKADSLYHPGKRTSEWLKIKHHKTMEAIIVGFTEPTGSRKYFGALILGTFKEKKLVYIGHTGTGFNDALLKELYDLLNPLTQRKSPFDEKIKTNSPATWLKPEIVCEVKYAEMTTDGKLRHPVFLHIRMDKNKKEVTMDKNKDVQKSDKKPVSQKAEKSSSKKSVSKKSAPQKKQSAAGNSQEKERQYTFGKSKVTVSNPGKIYFPEDELTKGDVVDYYQSMAKYILPHLKGRPQSLLRNPNGIHEKGFFHKDAAENVPPYVSKVIVHSESNNKEIDYIVCDNAATLVYMNNLGCIEINPWPATVKDLENPDYMIIDIDPSDKNTFDQVVEVALVVKEILDKAGANSFCKTSGASGLHVYVPTGKKYSFEQVKDLALIISTLVHEQLKEITTLERSLKKRSYQKIYMDYLQNRRGQTLAAVYSLRPKVGATVSTPLLWEEVKKGLSPKQFTVHNIKDRVDKKGDLFKGVLGKGIDLKKCLKNLAE
ncbi:MAG: DNA ligase D [Ginsengibacter sp.]